MKLGNIDHYPSQIFQIRYITYLAMSTKTISNDVLVDPVNRDITIHLVTVQDITPISGALGDYKRVLLLEEQGYWCQQFYFNLFDSNTFYPLVQSNMKLRIKVSPFSKQFRTLISVEILNFESCNICLKYMETCDNHKCDGNEEATRVDGTWILNKIVKTETHSRLYFQRHLCLSKHNLFYVLFNTDKELKLFKEQEKLPIKGVAEDQKQT